jgi:hypothetical protein
LIHLRGVGRALRRPVRHEQNGLRWEAEPRNAPATCCRNPLQGSVKDEAANVTAG